MEIATEVKQCIYQIAATTGTVPLLAQVAEKMDLDLETIRTTCAELAQLRVLVLEPRTGEIVMAPPFSGVLTQHRVLAQGLSYYGNCIWDAFGIPAALHGDAEVRTECGDCGEPLEFTIVDGRLDGPRCVIHYALPAARWWDDIVFT